MFLRLELGLGEHTLRLQFSELFELRELAAHPVFGGVGGLVRGCLLGRGLLRFLLLRTVELEVLAGPNPEKFVSEPQRNSTSEVELV